MNVKLLMIIVIIIFVIAVLAYFGVFDSFFMFQGGSSAGSNPGEQFIAPCVNC